MKHKNRLTPSFLPPITANGKIPDLRDISGIILRNAGTNTVNLENGCYTLDSKETLSLNVTEPDTVMDIFNVQVSFSGAGTNILQLIVLYPSDC